MAKDPAFLFYSTDFLMGVSDLTMEERGKYITLLCLQHQKGPLSEKAIGLAVGSISADLRKKFDVDGNGNLFNQRLLDEATKRASFAKSRRNNAKKYKAKSEHMPEHMVNVNESVNIDEFRDTIDKYNGRDEIFKRMWETWVVYRSEIKKPYKSDKSRYGALKSIMAYDDETAILMLQQSINNQWQGIFQLKTNYNGTKTDHNNKQAGLGNLNEQAQRLLSGFGTEKR